MNNKLHSVQPLLENVGELRRFMGQYYLVDFINKLDKNKQPYWLIRISDCSNELTIYCFNQQYFYSSLELDSLIHVEVVQKHYKGQQYFHCVYLESMDN